MKALILAGGLGTRLRDVIGDDIPKPMAPIDGRPFLEYQIAQLRGSGIRDIVLSVCHLKETIMDYFGDGSKFDVKIRYSIETTPLGTGGAILKALPKIGPGDFLVMNGDTLAYIDLVEFVLHHGRYDRTATIAASWFYRKGQITPEHAGVYLFKDEIYNHIEHNKFMHLDKDILEPMRRKDFMYYEIGHFLDIGTPESYAKAQEEIPKWSELLVRPRSA